MEIIDNAKLFYCSILNNHIIFLSTIISLQCEIIKIKATILD